MRRVTVSLAIVILWAAHSFAHQSAVPPQTARQALMEMFFSKTQGTFAEHLPAATRIALEKSGALANLQQYSLLVSQLQTQSQNIQTFDTGSVMLAGEDPKTGQKVEIMVENDALNGDQDDIELSFQIYKNGQVQRTPFMPQMTFSMKKEAQVWTLNEISITLHLPLADPDLLKAITENMRPQTANSSRVQTAPQTAGTDAQVTAAMRSIVSAEATYATTYPTVGFTCTLSNLDGFGGGVPNERQAMLINSGLASGKRYGYVFTLSECNGTPATAYHLTAVPNRNSFRGKAYCADQSGVIRSSEDGNLATCLASGTSIQ
jgi:type IV pilus assembly protein PilA